MVAATYFLEPPMSASSVALVSDPVYQKHRTGEETPETPDRVRVIDEALKELGLQCLEPRLATSRELTLCHSVDYIRQLQEECLQCPEVACDDSILSTDSYRDTRICRESYEVARYAVGGVLSAVDAVMSGQVQKVFCNIRPPGHHACPNLGMGFCLFNNVAIAARYAQIRSRSLGANRIDRVLIADWDAHHGNGTQEIFWKDRSVFYFSTHQESIYPETGLTKDVGEGQGKGTTLNVPVKANRYARERILNAYQRQLVSAMEEFQPQLVLVSAGFDSREGDPIGSLNLKDSDFAQMTRILAQIAQKWAKNRMIVVLEGGYNLKGIALAAKEVVKTLAA